VAESSIRLKVEAAGAVAALNQTSAASRRVSKSVNVLGTALKALPFIGIAEAARRFFGGFAEADKATAAIRTLGVDADKLKPKLLGVSNELKGLVSQTELTAAAYDVASAGFTNATDAAQILKAASLGAVGGLSDLNTVADATTSVLNAYGLSSDKAAGLVDKFIQTQNDGKIVVAQYASQIGRVAPIAAAAGVGIDELNAAISAVTATGVPVESTFAGLRQAIASVIKPTKEAEETSKLLGIEFSSAAIKAKGFGGFLEDVINKTGGSEVALTKLFGSVEAVATILPLANDNLVKFNSSLDNQKDSAGAAEKATEDLGGTVSAQITSIVNNIGNVARALDRVLGPALKSILQDLNNIISAASTAISKFTDLATGAVSRSAAALQAAASTGFASKNAFIALKESIGTLKPELAQSETDLLKLEGALDEAGRAALRFTGKGDFGNLRNNVLDAVTAMRRLIIARREALESATGQQGGGQNIVDPELLALRERIRQLLDQQNKSDTDIDIDPLASLKGQIQTLKEGVSLAKTRTEEESKQQQLLNQIASLTAIRTDANAALVDEAIKLTGQLFYQTQLQDEAAETAAQTARDKKDAQDAEARRLDAIEQKQKDIAQAIQNQVVGAIESAIDGSKSLAESFSGLLKQLAMMIIKQKIIGNFQSLGGGGILGLIPGLADGGPARAGRPHIVGERGPELFVPNSSGTVVPNHAMGGNASVTVNVDASGSSVEGDGNQAAQLGKAIGIAVQQELIKQKRPGGLLTR